MPLLYFQQNLILLIQYWFCRDEECLRVMVFQNAVSIFQKQAGKRCIIQLKYLQRVPETPLHEAGNVKPNAV